MRTARIATCLVAAALAAACTTEPAPSPSDPAATSPGASEAATDPTDQTQPTGPFGDVEMVPAPEGAAPVGASPPPPPLVPDLASADPCDPRTESAISEAVGSEPGAGVPESSAGVQSCVFTTDGAIVEVRLVHDEFAEVASALEPEGSPEPVAVAGAAGLFAWAVDRSVLAVEGAPASLVVQIDSIALSAWEARELALAIATPFISDAGG